MGLEQNFWSHLLAVVPALITAGTVIYGARILASRQHQSDKWWETRATTYTELIAALARIKYALDLWQQDGMGLTQISKEENKELNVKFKSAKIRLVESRHAGAFALHQDAAKSLDRLLETMESNE